MLEYSTLLGRFNALEGQYETVKTGCAASKQTTVDLCTRLPGYRAAVARLAEYAELYGEVIAQQTAATAAASAAMANIESEPGAAQAAAGKAVQCLARAQEAAKPTLDIDLVLATLQARCNVAKLTALKPILAASDDARASGLLEKEATAITVCKARQQSNVCRSLRGAQYKLSQSASGEYECGCEAGTVKNARGVCVQERLQRQSFRGMQIRARTYHPRTGKQALQRGQQGWWFSSGQTELIRRLDVRPQQDSGQQMVQGQQQGPGLVFDQPQTRRYLWLQAKQQEPEGGGAC